MIRQVRNTLMQYQMLRDHDMVLCGLSGGADSVCLLLTLKELQVPICACHYHHGLRGETADADERFCRALCKQYGIRYFSERGNVRQTAVQKHLSIETAAREERYAFFHRCLEVLRQEGYMPVAATAHNADDNLETMLFHLLRGTGTAGLAGIPPINPPFIRPLIAVERRQIEAYLIQHGQTWRTDETNLDDSCTRNRIRHHVMPALREIEPSAARHAVHTAELLRQENAYLDAQAQVIGTTLDRMELLSEPPVIAARKLRKLMQNAGVREIGHTHIEAVWELLGQPKGQYSLPGQMLAVHTGTQLVIRPQQKKPEQLPLTIDQPVQFGVYTIVFTQKISDIYSSFIQYPVCYDTINTLQMTVRGWKPRDRMRLSGMRGERTLKRLYAERGIRPEERDAMPVICCGEKIIAAAGIGVHEEYSGSTGFLLISQQKRE